MAIHYDDSTIWDYTLHDVTSILLTFVPYTMLLLIAFGIFLKYKENIFDILEKIYDFKNHGNMNRFLSHSKSRPTQLSPEQELIQKLLENEKLKDQKLMEIQGMIGDTNEKLQSFSQRLDCFQDMKDLCTKKYGEITTTFNDFSSDVMGKLEKMGKNNYYYQEQDGGNYLMTEDSVQDPSTKDAVQDFNKVDSEIAGPNENELKKNSSHRSRIPVFKKISSQTAHYM